MNIQTIFLDSEGRLRSGWRATVFSILFLFLTSMLSVAVVAILAVFSAPPEHEGGRTFLLSSSMLLIPALFVGWLCGRWFERLPFAALGASFTSGWFKHLILGLAVGALTFGLAVFVAFAGGGLRFEINQVDVSTLISSLLFSLSIFAVGAAAEEALFRGYIFQTFVRSGLAIFAICLTSVFFGALHVSNPDAGLISTVNTILAGIWFCVAYLKTRDLWFVWGAHLMWNWMQGSIFGIEVSGLGSLTANSLLREVDSGPVWLTGGSYGIEGGIGTTIAMAVSTVVIWNLPWLGSEARRSKRT